MNIKNKTGRKNKTKQTVTWPCAHFFTIEDMFETNPDFVKITMRTRVKSAIESGTIKEIGILHNKKGRPHNVYAMTPVSKDTIEQAKQAQVCLHSEYKTTMVVDIDSNSNSQSVNTNTVNTGKPVTV